MTARLSKLKHLQVIDAEDGPIVHIRLEPQITAGECRWVGASLEVDLSAQITAEAAVTSGLPAVRIACTTARTTGETTVELAADGRARSFTVRFEPTPGEVPETIELAFTLEVLSQGHSEGAGVYAATLTENKIALSIPVSPPSSPTRLVPKITSVGKPAWVDLVAGIAAFDAAISIHVDGPFVSDKRILLVTPPDVTQLEFSPRFIRPGDNTIQLRVRSRVRPAPEATELLFELRPPDQDVVRVEVSGPLHLRIVGPEPARLVLLDGSEVLSSLEIRSPGAVTVTPSILGAPAAAVPETCAASFAFERSLSLEMETPQSPIFAPVTIMSRGRDDNSRSFFFDTIRRGHVEVTLSPSSGAVHGSKYSVTERESAPFKRILFALAVALAVLCVVFLPFRFFSRLQSLPLTPASDEVKH